MGTKQTMLKGKFIELARGKHSLNKRGNHTTQAIKSLKPAISDLNLSNKKDIGRRVIVAKQEVTGVFSSSKTYH